MNPHTEKYHKHRDRRLIEMRRYMNKPSYRASRLVSGAKKRALKVGLEFDLDTSWVTERVAKGQCEVTGIQFEMITGRSAFAPSLDRIDPQMGYTRENVQVVVWAYNAAKGVASHEEVLRLAHALINPQVGQ